MNPGHSHVLTRAIPRYLDGTLKALNPTLGKRDPNSIICQQWVVGDGTDVRERLLAGTIDGEVLVMEVRRPRMLCTSCRAGHNFV